MKTQLFKAENRGQANHDWLQARFSFSFANYFNPENISFGLLRVLNDDIIGAGTGFGTHPHDNMEIITIPLQGALKHKDSMGNEGVIKFGEVQVMSAGMGVTHSEMNASETEIAKTLQIWIFPNKENVRPRYDQKAFDIIQNKNSFVNVVSPKNYNDGNALWVHQNTFLNLGTFDANLNVNYTVNFQDNGVYLFLLEGKIEVDGVTLDKRDALGITDFESFEIKTIEPSTILLIEVPMNHN